MATQTLLTYEEYRNLPEQEGVVRELDEGRLIEMAHPSFEHGAAQGRVAHFLHSHIEETSADLLVSQNTGFLLAPDVERAPDICVLRRAAFAAMERVRGVLRGCPDLAVEVVSESDSAADIDRKLEQYLRAGATAVWVLYPDTHNVLVRRRSGQASVLSSGQIVEEPELLAGLKIPIDQIFAL